MDERRHFQRIAIAKHAEVIVDGNAVPCNLIDISFKGALLAFDGTVPEIGQTVDLHLDLDEKQEIRIYMHATVEHVEGQLVGVQCHDITLDDMQTLRRLIELNLGDAELLNRELKHLVDGG